MSKKIFKKSEPYEEENIFFSLGPKDDVDEDNIYYNKFMTAVNKGCKIIAFTGRYGIGKTSIINSILKKLHNKGNNIRISLGNYRNAKTDDEEGKVDEVCIDSNDIETKILQQIIYTTNENKLPMSRFKRIKYTSNAKRFFSSLTILILMILVYVYYPKIYEVIFNKFYDTAIVIFPKTICIFLCFILFLGIWYVIYRFVMEIKTSINISSLKYKDLEISVKNNDERSAFNKYLDEIVYFFKQTKTNMLIIEDLDRYGNISLEIFKRLKELNFLLNSNETIRNNGGVLFIYALRDDLFLNNEDRVKFFDNIIPVVSKFSNQNVKEYIMELYKEFHDKYELNIDEKLLRVISIYIQDRRLLLNIFMEFKTYVDNLKNNQHINYTELFAVICYKNINPIDFEKRLKYNGDLYNVFNYKNEFINILNKELILKNDNIRKEIIEMKKLRNLDIIDLKKAFLLDVLKDLYPRDYLNRIKLYIDDDEFSIDRFLDYEINTSILKDSTFEYAFPNYSKQKINSETVNIFLNKVDNLNYDFKKMEKEIDSNLEQIKINAAKTVEEIFNVDELLELISDVKIKKIFENKLLISLVKNGFIKENYEKSLSFFKTGDLSPEDYKFLIYVDTNDKLEFNYKINNVKEVINIIDTKEFLKESLLNNDVVDFLLKQGSKLKKNNLISQLKKINNYKLNFLEQYMLYNKNNFITLLKEIYNDELLNYIFEDDKVIKNKETWFKLIIENIDLNSNSEIVSLLKKYIEKNIGFLNKIEINNYSKENIVGFSINIENYEQVDINIIDILYHNNIYNSNKSFYKKLIELYEINNKYNEMDVIEILYNNPKFIAFKNRILQTDTFSSLYNDFELYDSSEESIIKSLNDLKMKKEDKLLILEKENNKITKINDIEDVSLWKEIIKNSYCNYSMENLMCYYNEIREIDDVIIEMLGEIGKDYHYIEDDNFEDFEHDLIYSDSNVMIDYNIIAKEFSYNIDSFDENLEINCELLDELINNNKVNLNPDTYKILLKDNINALIKLIINSIDELINIKDEIELNSYIADDIMLSDIDITKKIQLFNNIEIDEISKEALSKITDEIINSKIYLNDELVENIFNQLSLEDKIKYFIYLHKENQSNIKYLYKIDDKISKIRNGNSTGLSFKNSDAVIMLMEYLYNINIINKFEIKNNKVYISYNKTKI